MPHVESMEDIGKYGTWTVSSQSQQDTIENLTDGILHTYWQSSGYVPHTITIQFPTVMKFHEIQMYLHHDLDDSYTPSKVSFWTGLNESKLVEHLELKEPIGYVKIKTNGNGVNVEISDESSDILERPTKGRNVCVEHCKSIVLSFDENHYYGRDVRVRQFNIYGLVKLGIVRISTFCDVAITTTGQDAQWISE